MTFLARFAIYGLIAAAILHVFVAVCLQRLVIQINKHGKGLVRQIGRGLPAIDYGNPEIPRPLREKFRNLKMMWGVSVPVFLLPFVLFLIFGRKH